MEYTLEVSRLFDHQCGGPVQGRPGHQERERGEPVVEALGVVEGLFFGLDVIEVGKPLQVCPEMGRRQRMLETAPPELLGLI